MTEKMPSPTSDLEEYKSINENMRHYANMRFAQLTLYFALNAALVTAIFATTTKQTEQFGRAFSVAALIATFVFVLLEERAADYWHHLRKRACTLEDRLGFIQWKDRPERKIFSATNAVRLWLAFSGTYWLLIALGRGVL